jgi:site-specific DNA-cytosine methylase
MAIKLASGGNIMRRELYIPKDYIGAFVGHVPTAMIHPKKDRYLTYRECLNIMGLPQDFNLIDPKKNLNHVCQNVPVSTAKDMADCVKDYLDGNITKWVEQDFMIQDNHKQILITEGELI